MVTKDIPIWWKKRSLWQRVFFVVGLGSFLTILGLVGLALGDLPSPTRLQSSDNLAVSTKILDRDGELLYEIFADENRTPIEIESLPSYVTQATISIEDKNFYNHFGLDFIGITRALLNNLRGKSLEGGSTLTQQLVKVSLLTNERTWERKVKEAILTLATEALYSKDDILEMYLNHVPYGGTAWGIEAASQTFFDKPASELTVAEATYLAGLPQSPSRYSPFGNSPQLGKERQREVLRRMVEDKYLTQEEADTAYAEKLNFAKNRFDIQAPHFVFYVRDQLVEKYGQAKVERGGLRVRTTLDLDLFKTVEASVSAEIATLKRLRVSNGAALVTNPSTGEILAMVGSHDYFDATAEGQINMTVRQRQPGSSMKPLNLATAYQLRRANPATVVLDIPTCFGAIGSENYCPRNYDGSYHGPVTMRQALANSYNIPAVKVGALNGIEDLIATTSAMGLSTFRAPREYGLSLPLGAAEVTMVDMATAFGSLANQGVKVPLISILSIEDYTGENLYQVDPETRRTEVEKQLFLAPKNSAYERSQIEQRVSNSIEDIYRALDQEVAWLVTDIMKDNDARAAAFGTRSQLYIPGHQVAAKTGTTNDLRDNWTVGFTPDFLTIVWVGNTDNTPMNQALVSGVTGAAPIWNDIMRFLLKNRATIWPEQPETIVEKSFCKRSGALPKDGSTCEMTTEKFWKGTEPTATENVFNGTWIVEQTGLPPREEDPTDKLKFEEHILLTDPFTRNYCLDCTRATVEITKEDGTKELKPVEESYFVPAERLFEVLNGGGVWRE